MLGWHTGPLGSPAWPGQLGPNVGRLQFWHGFAVGLLRVVATLVAWDHRVGCCWWGAVGGRQVVSKLVVPSHCLRGFVGLQWLLERGLVQSWRWSGVGLLLLLCLALGAAGQAGLQQRRRGEPREDPGHGRHGHGGEYHDIGLEEFEWSNSEQAEFDWEQEGNFISERDQARRNHMVDIENMHWQMLEESSILADGTEEANAEELERIAPSRPEVFNWHRGQH